MVLLKWLMAAHCLLSTGNHDKMVEDWWESRWRLVLMWRDSRYRRVAVRWSQESAALHNWRTTTTLQMKLITILVISLFSILNARTPKFERHELVKSEQHFYVNQSLTLATASTIPEPYPAPKFHGECCEILFTKQLDLGQFKIVNWWHLQSV